MKEDNLKEENLAGSFKEFMEKIAQELHKTFNPNGENKIGFCLVVFDPEGEDTANASMISNTKPEIVTKVLNVYVSQQKHKQQKTERRLIQRIK